MVMQHTFNVRDLGSNPSGGTIFLFTNIHNSVYLAHMINAIQRREQEIKDALGSSFA